jgi:polar amino acid transport system permease protein
LSALGLHQNNHYQTGAPLKNKRITVKSLDGAVIIAIIAIGIYIALRIKVGLHYSWEWEAIPQFLFRFDPEKGKWVTNVLSQGFLTTIRLSIWGTILAIIIGTVMGLFRTSRSLFRRLLGRSYIELIRNLPPIVLIFIFYYFISDQILTLLRVEEFILSRSESTLTVLAFFFASPDLLPQFLSALITLAVFEGAYIAEIIRAGIQSIDKGQWEASDAIGLTRRQQMFVVILPQAVKKILPPLSGQFISTIKDSAIVSVISIQELTFQGMELMSSTYLIFEIWITITILYLILTLSLSVAVSRLEKHLARNQS